MFNLPEFLLRPRRTYAPTGNPMIDLGWETPGDVMSDTRQARTPATISYRDTLAQRQNPLMEAAQDNQINMPVAPISDSAPGRSITFTTPGGVETARYGADNAFAGGNYRGQGYATLNDRPAAMDAFSRLQGARETGISGMPSVEGIMQNQLGGLPMAPEQKRVMALGLQDKLVNPLAALERDRVQGQFGVQEAEARRRDYLSSKQSEILGYHMSQLLEQNPNATPEQITAYRDRIAMANGMTMPKSTGTATSAVGAATVNPLSNAAYSNASRRIQSLFAPDKGTPLPNRDIARTLGDILGDAEEGHREKLAQQAALAAAGNPSLLDDLVRQAAGDWSITGMPVKQFTYESLPSAPPRISNPLGLPIELVQDNRTNSWSGLGRGARALMGDAQAMYSHALLPGNRRVPLDASDLSRGPLGGASAEDIQRAWLRQLGLNPLLRVMLAPQIEEFERTRGK